LPHLISPYLIFSYFRFVLNIGNKICLKKLYLIAVVIQSGFGQAKHGFSIRHEPIFATAPVASKTISKNAAQFKSGQKRLENNHLASLVSIRDTLYAHLSDSCLNLSPSSPGVSNSVSYAGHILTKKGLAGRIKRKNVSAGCNRRLKVYLYYKKQ